MSPVDEWIAQHPRLYAVLVAVVVCPVVLLIVGTILAAF